MGSIVPAVPLINFNFESNNKSFGHYRGYSGSPIMNSNNIVGMIIQSNANNSNNANKETITAIPTYLLYKFMKDLIDNKNISIIRLSSQLVKININGQNCYGHKIINSFDISYNTDTKKNFILKDYYIILESKGCIITKDLKSINGDLDQFISYKDFYREIKKGVNQNVVSKKTKA
jgi:hypothetical protein